MPASWRDRLTAEEAAKVRDLDRVIADLRGMLALMREQLQVYRARAGMRSAYLKRKVLDTPAQSADT